MGGRAGGAGGHLREQLPRTARAVPAALRLLPAATHRYGRGGSRRERAWWILNLVMSCVCLLLGLLGGLFAAFCQIEGEYRARGNGARAHGCVCVCRACWFGLP